MNAIKEDICISALYEICANNFSKDEYSLNGPKESAVCLEKVSAGWNVYEKEKNSRNDTFLFDNVVEACLDFLRRLSSISEYKQLKETFFDAIIAQKSA